MSAVDTLPAEASAETGDLAVNLRHLPFETDAGIGARAVIGVIVLASDQTLEHEWRKVMALPGVAFYESRIEMATQVTPETLRAMEPRIAGCAGVILPGMELDVVAFGCTSAAMVIGEERVAEKIREARPGIACTNPMTAARAAFAALGARRIALLTPYIEEINQAMRRHIEQGGPEVTAMGSFNEENDNVAARISPASIKQAALALGRGEQVDAVFVSCTSLRLVDVVAELEAELGKPVTSSNHAMAWHALRLAGIDDRLPQLGRLYQQALG